MTSPHTFSSELAALISNYHELNPSFADELTHEPSPLTFMRYVARNRPFVVRRGAAHWAALRTWDAAGLKAAMADRTVNVAVTPNGRADAPTPHRQPSGADEVLFAKPCEEDQLFEDFLEYVMRQERRWRDGDADVGEIRYAQTQNDNLRGEYASLFAAVQPTIPWASAALQQSPDAINLWIGNSRSVTALHRDNYENVYVQVAGRKHFVLLPPLAVPCVRETALPPAVWRRAAAARTGLELVPDDVAPAEYVPFPLWDPDDPALHATPFSPLAQPLRVDLDPGDMLYLPAMWYHKVSQSCSAEGLCVAVNYWYDMDFQGALVPLCDMVRNMSRAAGSGAAA